MANAEHLARLNEGVQQWNRWREENPAIVPDLSNGYFSHGPFDGANFAEADLSRSQFGVGPFRGTIFTNAKLMAAQFIYSDLESAIFASADLVWTYFFNVNLRGAGLRGARLGCARFSQADLSLSDVQGADLSDAIFHRARFDGADLAGCGLSQTTFGDTDFKKAKGLAECLHHAPSTLGVDTIFRSGGEIPEAFLRGCGLPDEFIAYAKALVGQSIQFHSCFISYSTKDQNFASRLHADLQHNGVRCWFAPHDMSSGKKVHEQIDEAIHVYDRLLLILSEDSIQSSWVDTEISKARKREMRENRRMLFPVRLVEFETLRDWQSFDADTGKDSAREIREFFIPDFRRWKENDEYQKAFDKLLRDLKSNIAAPASSSTIRP